MKKIIASIFVLFLITNINAKDWSKIRIGTEGAYPPFNFTDKDGNLVGLEIDYANALCEALKVDCVFVTQDWDGIIPGLMAKKYDTIMASMSITDERKKTIDFSKSYYKAGNSFVAKKGAFPNTEPATLAGKTIGVQKATISENFINDNYKQNKINTYVSIEEAFLDLVAGRVDLVFNDTINNYGSFLDTEQGKDYTKLGPEYVDTRWFGYGVGAGLRKEDQDLKDLINKGIDMLNANGTFKEISEKWLPGVDISPKY